MTNKNPSSHSSPNAAPQIQVAEQHMRSVTLRHLTRNIFVNVAEDIDSGNDHRPTKVSYFLNGNTWSDGSEITVDERQEIAFQLENYAKKQGFDASLAELHVRR